MIMDGLEERTNETPFFIEGRDYAEQVFGNLEDAVKSDKNPEWMVKKLAEEGKELPHIYMTCGTEDSLIEKNRAFSKILKNAGVDITYEEGPGGHEWDFWDRSIKRVLEWLPLEEENAGINSGNVGL